MNINQKVTRKYNNYGVVNNYIVIINGMIFHDQFIDFDIKRYEEIRKWTTGKGKDYTTGFLLDYDLRNRYRLI